MWYLWGENLSRKPFKVIGINTDTKQEVVIFNDKVLGSELNDADAHTPSTMEFPTAGIWNLDAYVGEELFGNIVVELNKFTLLALTSALVKCRADNTAHF
ncbi:hypothetical protein J45TS6_47810 [Paenibacillus sp. J45TS6]|nr:hypothetical protein J45TS6_47810 [Paenibacillus sp. J45TS6]